MEIISSSDIGKAVRALKNGELVAFPTETVFGIGVIYDNEDSYHKLINAKKRPPEKPFTLMCADLNDIHKYAFISRKAKVIIEAFMPGQLTIILKAKKRLPEWVVSQEGNVGIRISSDEMIRTLIRRVGKPLLVPSANRSGEKPALSAEEVKTYFGEEISVIISGQTSSNVPSTVVDAVGSIQILRQGLISKEQINEALKEAKL